jgi:hypothetical protein
MFKSCGRFFQVKKYEWFSSEPSVFVNALGQSINLFPVVEVRKSELMGK